MTRAAVIVLAVAAALGLGALGELGRAYASRAVFPGAQHNFSGELGSKVLTNSGGPLQLGAACAEGNAGDVCLGGALSLGGAIDANAWNINAAGSIIGNNAAGARLAGNDAASATVPTLMPNRGDTDSGLGSAGADQPAIVAGGQTAVVFVESSNEVQQGWDPCTFGNLGTPGNGRFCYCSDCTKATPCAGAGTGALAKRLNGAWDCD